MSKSSIAIGILIDITAYPSFKEVTVEFPAGSDIKKSIDDSKDITFNIDHSWTISRRATYPNHVVTKYLNEIFHLQFNSLICIDCIIENGEELLPNTVASKLAGVKLFGKVLFINYIDKLYSLSKDNLLMIYKELVSYEGGKKLTNVPKEASINNKEAFKNDKGKEEAAEKATETIKKVEIVISKSATTKPASTKDTRKGILCYVKNSNGILFKEVDVPYDNDGLTELIDPMMKIDFDGPSSSIKEFLVKGRKNSHHIVSSGTTIDTAVFFSKEKLLLMGDEIVAHQLTDAFRNGYNNTNNHKNTNNYENTNNYNDDNYNRIASMILGNSMFGTVLFQLFSPTGYRDFDLTTFMRLYEIMPKCYDYLTLTLGIRDEIYHIMLDSGILTRYYKCKSTDEFLNKFNIHHDQNHFKSTLFNCTPVNAHVFHIYESVNVEVPEQINALFADAKRSYDNCTRRFFQ